MDAQHHPGFSGGMEFLFDNKRQHTVELPAFSSSDGGVNGVSEDSTTPAAASSTRAPADLRFLIKWMLNNLLVDRARSDLFVQGDTVYVFSASLALFLLGRLLKGVLYSLLHLQTARHPCPD
jgi:hypothetical protein